MQDDREQRVVDLEPIFVVDKPQSLEFLHKEIHARSRRADHFRQRLLGDRRDGPCWFVALAVPREQQQLSRQPFLAGAKELVDEVFTPQDVFRIDHYLGKETVQNLLALRFANTLFEPIWTGHHVDSVQITMAEDVGIGGRAQFYEKTGAARDVLQNHLLQLLALTAMEEPVEFSAEEIRTEKLKILRAISLPTDLETFAIRGQYEQGWLAGARSSLRSWVRRLEWKRPRKSSSVR